MLIKRLEFSDAPIELIDSLAGNYFFSSTAFGRLWESMKGRPVYWTVEDNGSVTAVLPGVEFGRGKLRRFQSMPNGCYGQILFNSIDESEKPKVASLVTERIAKEKYVKAYMTDFHKTITASEKYSVDKHTVFIVAISASDWEPPDSKLRQQIHKAERENLKLEKFNAEVHIDEFMRLHDLHEKRRKVKSGYTRKFFESLANIAANDLRINWIRCTHENRPVSSHIFFTEGDSILHWQMYYDDELSHLQATKYVPYQIARQSAVKGAVRLNLGLSPSGAEGAEFYKKKWGGEPYDYNRYYYKSLLGKLR